MTKLYMMIGIAGSGKTSRAKLIDADYFGSDELREEMFGFQDLSRHVEVFEELHKRIINNLKKGRDTIYDATNLSGKRRQHFLRQIQKLKVEKIAIVVFSPYEVCLERRSAFETGVVLEQMKRFNFPLYSEGWDHILIRRGVDEETIKNYKLNLIVRALGFDQRNPHHNLKLGDHMKVAQENVEENNSILRMALYIHDYGKLYTGKEGGDGFYHYYAHENVSAYLAMAFTRIPEVCQIVQHHMLPMDPNFQTSRKIKEKLGGQLIEKLNRFHIADKAAKG